MGFWELALLIAIIIFGLMIAYALAVSSAKKAMENSLTSIEDFTSSQQIMSNTGDTGIAIDEERKKVALLSNSNGESYPIIITYRDLLSSEIYVDGETVTRTARGSQIGGALIGALAFGGVGAIIGGLSGKTRSAEKVKRVDLRITINDTKRPFHDINFMDVESKKDGWLYKTAMEQARHWHSLIAVLIKMADNEDTLQNADKSEDKNKLSLADELEKLSVLRDKGILSEQEFSTQKDKLLS